MNRIHQLLLLVLSVALLAFTGCGDKEQEPDIPPVPEFTDEPEIPLEPEEEEEPEEETDDRYHDSELPPEEGMVRSALTNEWIPQEKYDARPIAVMMPTDKVAQPQYGIGNASVLYEIMEEGNISRQMAVIEDWQDLEKIGNIRSCRDYYLYAACEWDPILIHFGGVFYMADRLAEGDINNISGAGESGIGSFSRAPEEFFRSTDKSAPHNAYISAEGIERAISSLGYSTQHRTKYYEPDHFRFAQYGTENDLSSAPKAIDCTTVNMEPCFPVSESMLEYNPEDQLYYKSLHGEAQIDAATGEQLTFTNIIVQYTDWKYQMDNKYLHFEMCDYGHGGWYITRGKAIPITWSKDDDYAPTRYFDKDGKEITLNTGKTYIAVVQDGREPDLQ